MLSICKKELRQFFSSLTGYIAIIVFLLVNGLMLFVFDDNILDFGYATLDRFFELAPWILLLLIPAITMRSFADEFKTGTFEILQTRPLTQWQIAGGKYFGSLIVVVIALLPTIVYYFSIQALSSGEGIDTGAAIGSYIGLFFLAGVFTSIGICVSSFTSNAVVAFIISLIACALLYYGFSAISRLPGLAGGMDYYIEMAGIDFHYRSISRGVIDTRDVIYFISVIVLFLAIAKRNITVVKKRLASKYSWLVLLILLFAVNFLASAFHSRIDLTKEKRYTLSSSTNELLRSLDDDMQIDVFLKGDFPSGFRKLANSTEEFVGLLKDRNGSKVHYRFISPQDEIPGTNGMRYQDTLAAMGASPINLTVQVKAGQEQKFVFPVAMVQYKGQTRLVNLYTGGNRYISQVEINNAEALLEYQFLKSMDELVYPEKGVIGYSAGNGEPTGVETYDLQETVRQRYDFYTFNLHTQRFIPDEFSAFIIVKPSLQFTEDELLKIDQYVMRGGNVLFFIDRLFAENDSLRYKPETVAFDRSLNLTDLLFRYGVRVNPDLVMDLQCDFLSLIVGGTQDNPQKEFLPWNYYPVFQSKDDHLINRNIGLIAGKFVNSIDTIKGTNSIKKTILLSSSANSRIISTPALISLNENKTTPEDDKFKSSNIPTAVLLEGNFTSLYRNRAGKAMMDSLQAAGMPFKQESDGLGKIIVAADGNLLLNEVDRQEGPLPMGWNSAAYAEYKNQTENGKYFIPFANRNFLTNCLEYFTNKPGIVETGNKEIVLRLLDATTVKEQKTTWQFINIGLPVLLVILAGLIYQAVRRRKYA